MTKRSKYGTVCTNFVLFIAAAFSLGHSASATIYTWANAGTDFTTSGNWINGTSGLQSGSPSSSDSASFATAASTQPNVGTSDTITSLSFGTGGTGYDLTSSSGAALTLTSVLNATTTSAIANLNTSGTNTIDATINLGQAANGVARFNQAAGGTLVLNGIISSANAIALQYASGLFTVTGNNTYTGTTALNSGTLNLNNAGAIGGTALTISGGTIDNTTASSIILNNSGLTLGANLTFTGTSSLSFGSGGVLLSGATRQVTVSGSTLTLGAVSQSATGFGITKAGAGTLVLGGASSYSGTTTISAGTLLANGGTTAASTSATGSGGVTVTGSGSVLGGSGRIASTGVTVGTSSAGATITGGGIGSIGVLTLVANTSLIGSASSKGIYYVDLGSSSTDQLAITGSLTLTNTQVTLNQLSGTTIAAGTYALASYSSETGSLPTLVGQTSNESLAFNTNGTELDLVVGVVPEPATWAAMGVFALLFGSRYGYRRLVG